MLEENLCLYQGKCNDMRDFLQRLESLHALDETNASKQSSNLTSLLQDSKVLYFFSSIALNYLPLVSQCTKYCISFTPCSGFFLLSQTFTISNFSPVSWSFEIEDVDLYFATIIWTITIKMNVCLLRCLSVFCTKSGLTIRKVIINNSDPKTVWNTTVQNVSHLKLVTPFSAWKVSVFGVMLVFPRIRSEYGAIGVSVRIQFKCRKIQTKITPNTDTFYGMLFIRIWFIKILGLNFAKI